MSLDLRSASADLFRKIQQDYCAEASRIDGSGSFAEDFWERRDEAGGIPGGGGLTRVLRNGGVFDQGGVNYSEVKGTLGEEMVERLTGTRGAAPFFATGVSLVFHPRSPLVPTTHANLRYLEVGGAKWFGGGADLTPYYLNEEDARHFHGVLKRACDRFDASWYPRFKKWCDEYFFLPHRGESRGVGGVFFDYLGRDDGLDLERVFGFVSAIGGAFTECYLPIVERRKNLLWTEAQKSFQLIRRGRYVEFNLLYDRGTLFGLKTNGRTESILMSLPPEVRWEYNFTPPPGTPEALLLEVLKKPRDWADS